LRLMRNFGVTGALAKTNLESVGCSMLWINPA